ncbi:MAG: FAD-dependent oxidoreductase [Cyanobacteria bacterium RM1_2_2]|nr:FAD-dependent oxidoreductase [Cyanobacteria bacterium RM1_2_2]
MTQSTRSYDFICFGDEVPGILAIVTAAREYRRRMNKFPSSLLMFKGNSQEGVGGHLVRGRLAYLDRSSVPFGVRQALQLDDFGDPPAIYKEFITRAGVVKVSLDPGRANTVLRQMLAESGVDILSLVDVDSLVMSGAQIAGIKLKRGETYLGRQFFDCTVNAELAQLAGVKKLPGFASLGLPTAELSVTLVFETEGLSTPTLRSTEDAYLRRFTNPNDAEAQGWLDIVAGSDPDYKRRIVRDLYFADGRLKRMDIGKDYVDIYSKALSIAYHSFRGTKMALAETGAVFDNANIAILPGTNRLSWNCLLFFVTAAEAETLARNNAKPTQAMLNEFGYVERWLKSMGATAVKRASELYIRHAGNIADAVVPLTGAQMMAGGVYDYEALGTFGYAFDARGGIEGLDQRAVEVGAPAPTFKKPLFNVGIKHALLKNVPNLAVLGPGSGFDGNASTAGRIIEYNVAVGQAVGIAACLALLTNRNLNSFNNPEIRSILVATGRLPKVYGVYDAAETQRLALFEKLLGVPIYTV